MVYRIAVGTLDGLTVTEHFGQCGQAALWDIDQETGAVTEVGTRPLPSPQNGGRCGGHDARAMELKLAALADCHIALMARIGAQAEKQLIHRNIVPLQYEGGLDEALRRVRRAYERRVFAKPPNEQTSEGESQRD
ncbi:MAG: hypothetical protein LBS11_01030 [Oscillospiraceae bacterium]|jgi:hypothetical protein|nr:hypothetical protein [Oscillospiraceae bacterium]